MKLLAPIAVLVLAFIGFTALSYQAEADLQPNAEDGFTLDSNVVVSGGFVTATLVAQDDEALPIPPGGPNPRIYAPDTNVSAAGQVAGGATPDGITVDECFIEDGNPAGATNCFLVEGDPNFGPIGCNPAVANTACIQIGDTSPDPDTTSGNMTIVASLQVTCTAPTLVGITGWQGDDSQDTDLVLCLPRDAPNITIEKVFDGDPSTPFFFQLDSAGPGCYVIIDGGSLLGVIDGGLFSFMPGQTANVYCGEGLNTITEQENEAATFVSLTCNEEPVDGPTLSLLVSDNFLSTACVYTNEAVEDNPELPNLDVTKVCVGSGFDATFDISIGELSETVPCGGTTSLIDADPATYTISEVINGPDADAFSTVIICDDGVIVPGLETTVTVDAASVSCVIINSFDPDGDGDGDGDGVDDLICSCTCCFSEIDIVNENTNVIGIENENENNNNNENNNANNNENNNTNENTNTNEQNQTSDQDQDNSNHQENNIDASPQINIDLKD